MIKINQEQIDKFHSGRMGEAEMSDFKQQLESDPSLKMESDLQADIVNGLKEFRKNELKARLDAINVGPSWVEFVQQSALMKSMGGVIVASVIGTGIYFLGEKNESIDTSNPITIEAPKYEAIEYVWDLGLETNANEDTDLDKPVALETSSESTEKSDSEPVLASTTAEVQSTTKLEVKAFKPTFETPNVENIEEGDQFVSSELDELPESNVSAVDNDPIDVKTEVTKSTTIKYKYYDGKLFLNGDFNKAPYEILEINNTVGRSIYVYYLGNYYKVGIADRLTVLPQVGDKELIQELELLRANK